MGYARKSMVSLQDTFCSLCDVSQSALAVRFRRLEPPKYLFYFGMQAQGSLIRRSTSISSGSVEDPPVPPISQWSGEEKKVLSQKARK
jgi:hypothetical protein